MLYKDYLNNRRGYQEESVEFMLETKHCCLYYKPGKGKTYPCIEAINEIDKSMNGKAMVLILSTADAIKNMWMVEIEPQHIMPAHTIYMTTMKAVQEKVKKELLAVKWDVIVIDECHKIKAHNTKISKLVYSLTRSCKYVYGLSGTPRGNSDVDIFCQFHNMHISSWGDMSYSWFVENMCTCDTNYYNGRMIRIPTGIAPRYLVGWNKNVAMHTRRVDYDEEDDMPPLVVKPYYIDYVPTKTYLNAEEGIIKLPDYESTLTKLVAISKAHQVANGFLYLDELNGKSVQHVDDRQYEKVYHLLSYLTQNDLMIDAKKIVIVYKFKYDLAVLKEKLRSINYTEDVNEFKTDNSKLLFLQCSHSESINLQVADAIIFYTMDYSYINYDQMIHRAWRMGRTKEVVVVPFIVKHTVEETIWNVVKQKGKLADLFYAIKSEA